MRSTLASNTSSFNGCLRLTIVNKLIIDSVHFKDINPGEVGGTLLHWPYRYCSEKVTRLGEPDGKPPLRLPRNTHPRPEKKMERIS